MLNPIWLDWKQSGLFCGLGSKNRYQTANALQIVIRGGLNELLEVGQQRELPNGCLFSSEEKRQTESRILKIFNKLTGPILLTTNCLGR